MIIKNLIEKIKDGANSPHYIVVFMLVAVSLASFGLGRLSVVEDNREGLIYVPSPASARLKASVVEAPGQEEQNGAGMYVASKNGQRYYLPWCSGARLIKEENKIWFNSKEEAEVAGYTPALNCKGL